MPAYACLIWCLAGYVHVMLCVCVCVCVRKHIPPWRVCVCVCVCTCICNIIRTVHPICIYVHVHVYEGIFHHLLSGTPHALPTPSLVTFFKCMCTPVHETVCMNARVQKTIISTAMHMYNKRSHTRPQPTYSVCSPILPCRTFATRT
jgi:hypothetical protein